MKNLKQFILLVSFLNVIVVYGQTNVYQPYPTGWGATWTSEVVIPAQGPTSYNSVHWVGDTTINGLNYIKVYNNSVYIGAVRQNPALQEVFFVNTQNIEFNIALNPSAQVGDTIYFDLETYKVLTCNVSHDLGSFVVTKLDSTLVDGSFRKVLDLTPVDVT